MIFLTVKTASVNRIKDGDFMMGFYNQHLKELTLVIFIPVSLSSTAMEVNMIA